MNQESLNNIQLGNQLSYARLTRLAPQPKNLTDTGLSRELVTDLICKHLLDQGALSLAELSRETCLSGAILESVSGSAIPYGPQQQVVGLMRDVEGTNLRIHPTVIPRGATRERAPRAGELMSLELVPIQIDP